MEWHGSALEWLAVSSAAWVIISSIYNTAMHVHTEAEWIALAETKPALAKLTGAMRAWGFDPVSGL
jgi:hypothetical protein